MVITWPFYSRATAPTSGVRYRVLFPPVLPRGGIPCGVGSGPLGRWRGVLVAVSLGEPLAVGGWRPRGRTCSRLGHTACPWGGSTQGTRRPEVVPYSLCTVVKTSSLYPKLSAFCHVQASVKHVSVGNCPPISPRVGAEAPACGQGAGAWVGNGDARTPRPPGARGSAGSRGPSLLPAARLRPPLVVSELWA